MKIVSNMTELAIEIISAANITVYEPHQLVNLLTTMAPGTSVSFLNGDMSNITIANLGKELAPKFQVRTTKDLFEIGVSTFASQRVNNVTYKQAAEIIAHAFDMEDWRKLDNELELKLRALSSRETLKVLMNDLEEATFTLVQGFSRRIKANFKNMELLFDVKEEVEDDGYRAPFKSFMSGIRTKLFLNKLKNTKTPMEAFNLVTEWLEEDQEFEGKFVYKDMVVIYSFEFDKDGRTICSEVKIGNKIKCEGCGKAHEMEIIFHLVMNITKDNVEKFYNSVVSFIKNFAE